MHCLLCISLGVNQRHYLFVLFLYVIVICTDMLSYSVLAGTPGSLPKLWARPEGWVFFIREGTGILGNLSSAELLMNTKGIPEKTTLRSAA